ncbi:MAG TPA: hypothetical protein VF192_11935 [Longimicrobiales bacterium]
MTSDRTRLALAAALLMATLAAPGAASAQEVRAAEPREATILKKNDDGSYVVLIDGDTLLAITRAMAAEDLNRRREVQLLRADVALKDSLIASYERTIGSFATFRQRDAEYVKALEEQLARYRELYETARQLRDRERWFALEGGLGATGDTRPALLAGVGVRAVRAWAFLQEENAGWFIGLNVPVF